jgi:hypothetical protein
MPSCSMPGRDRHSSTADELLASLAMMFRDEPAVTIGQGRGFGSETVQVNGRIFAMVSAGRLVLKLPRKRVQALVDGGEGIPFEAGKGRPMKEWVALPHDSHAAWRDLAREALLFVSGLPAQSSS